MIVNYYGTGVLGSVELETSVANQEIIPSNIIVYNFELQNDQDCTMSINGSNTIFIRADQGIKIPIVKSCKIIENNITYNWIGIKG